MHFKKGKWNYLFMVQEKKHEESKALITPVLWATLGEGAIILWIISDFFASIERPKVAVVWLSLSLFLYFIFVAHKLLESDWGIAHKRMLYFATLLLSILVASVSFMAIRYFDEKWRLANEPQVFPSAIILNDGRNGILSRVLISNPSDSWIYRLMVLLQVQNKSVPLESVKEYLSDAVSSDGFNQNGPSGKPNFLLSDSAFLDVVHPNTRHSGGRLLVLFSLAPKEQRALWIRGTFPTNSSARMIIIEYTKTPFSLKIENGMVIWEGPSTNSKLWNFFPGVMPKSLRLDVPIRGEMDPRNKAPAGWEIYGVKTNSLGRK
jgi:hypothetical protein